MRALHWFRSDLRIRDNIALSEAARAQSNGLLAVFAICPEQWREHDWGNVKVEFLVRNLSSLSDALSDLNIALRIVKVRRFDEVPQKLLKLAEKHKCDALYFNQEYEINEVRRDDVVTRLFEESGRRVRVFHDQVIQPPGSVLTRAGGWYTVFTPFKRAWIERYESLENTLLAQKPRRLTEWVSRPSPVPKRMDLFDLSAGRPDLWKEGERHAKARLSSFVRDRLDRYDHQRDIPGVNGTSTLSAYLALGVISPRQCLLAARSSTGGSLTPSGSRGSGAATWISELIWREFYKHLLIGFPRLSMCRPFRIETEGISWRTSRKDFKAWCRGETGYPIVDAAMRQLNRTGWMHNRLRMITAMFLTKDLLLDWRWGERYFMENLVDGDLASNNGGWQWSASTGTDAAPYFRIFNPFQQSRRYDPEGKFIKKFLPELRSLEPAALHDPKRLDKKMRARLDYPEPICDHSVARQRAILMFRRRSDSQ